LVAAPPGRWGYVGNRSNCKTGVVVGLDSRFSTAAASPRAIPRLRYPPAVKRADDPIGLGDEDMGRAVGYGTPKVVGCVSDAGCGIGLPPEFEDGIHFSHVLPDTNLGTCHSRISTIGEQPGSEVSQPINNPGSPCLPRGGADALTYPTGGPRLDGAGLRDRGFRSWPRPSSGPAPRPTPRFTRTRRLVHRVFRSQRRRRTGPPAGWLRIGPAAVAPPPSPPGSPAGGSTSTPGRSRIGPAAATTATSAGLLQAPLLGVAQAGMLPQGPVTNEIVGVEGLSVPPAPPPPLSIPRQRLRRPSLRTSQVRSDRRQMCQIASMRCSTWRGRSALVLTARPKLPIHCTS